MNEMKIQFLYFRSQWFHLDSAEACTAKVNPEHSALGFAEHPYFERKRSHFIISHHQMLACGSC
jgi:hypothetical protein